MKNSSTKRHKDDTKTFEELSFAEQAKAINIKALWFLSAARNHINKCALEHGSLRAAEVPKKVAQQLRSMASQIENLATPEVASVPVTTNDPDIA
jgi:hypothetical protein